MRSLIIFMAVVFLALGTISAGAQPPPATATYDKFHAGYDLCVTNSSGDATTSIQVVNIQLSTPPSSVTAPQGWLASRPPTAQWSTQLGGIITGQTLCGFDFRVKAKLSSPQTVNVTFCTNTSMPTCSPAVSVLATSVK